MDPLAYHRAELQILQSRRHSLISEIRSLKGQIQNKVKLIDELENPKLTAIDMQMSLISRDRDICADYILTHPGCPSKDLVKHLNEILRNELTRWPKNQSLDSNTFMTRMGIYLTEKFGFKSEFQKVDGSRSKVWTKVK